MTSAKDGIREISLGRDFGDVAVTVNGVRIEVHADGSVDAYTAGAVNAYPAANNVARPQAKAGLLVGDRMDDGTIFAGISPDTSEPMYTTPADAPLTYTFNQAKKYAAKLDAHGHQDWRVPTTGELKVLFKNRASIGGFDETGLYPAGWYCSSTENDVLHAWGRRFSGGYQFSYGKDRDSSLRCVR